VYFLPSASIIKSRPQFRRRHRTNLHPPPKNSVTHPRNKIIHAIANHPWNYGSNSSNKSPESAHPPKNVNKRVRTNQQSPIIGQDNDAIRQPRPPFRRNQRSKRRPLQRRVAKSPPLRIPRDHKSHSPMAQSAMSIIKNSLGPRRRTLNSPPRISRQFVCRSHKFSSLYSPAPRIVNPSRRLRNCRFTAIRELSKLSSRPRKRGLRL
jgi:hypothetical protein